jgi:hypothetical protein
METPNFVTYQSPEKVVSDEPVHLLKYFALAITKLDDRGPWVIGLNRYTPGGEPSHTVEFSVVKFLQIKTKGVNKDVIDIEKNQQYDGFIHFTYLQTKFYAIVDVLADEKLTKLNPINKIFTYLKT